MDQGNPDDLARSIPKVTTAGSFLHRPRTPDGARTNRWPEAKADAEGNRQYAGTLFPAAAARYRPAGATFIVLLRKNVSNSSWT
jgi:hypothetical protein